jgi:hypothetical protein
MSNRQNITWTFTIFLLIKRCPSICFTNGSTDIKVMYYFASVMFLSRYAMINEELTVYPNHYILCTYTIEILNSDTLFFSSPELKAQVSYSDRLLSVIRLTSDV